MFALPLSELLGFLGVAILLIAFFLNLFGWSPAGSWRYLGLNLVGATLACVSSYMINFMPFVLLEGTWALVAACALTRKLLSRSEIIVS